MLIIIFTITTSGSYIHILLHYSFGEKKLFILESGKLLQTIGAI